MNYSGDGLLGRALREQGIEGESRFTVKGRIGTRQFIQENSDPLLNFLKLGVSESRALLWALL